MQTRRNFLGTLLVAGATFTILPGAGRLWRARRRTRLWKVNPEWVNAEYAMYWWSEVPLPHTWPPGVGDVTTTLPRYKKVSNMLVEVPRWVEEMA